VGEENREGTNRMKLAMMAVLVTGVSGAAMAAIPNGEDGSASPEATSSGEPRYLVHINGRATSCVLAPRDRQNTVDAALPCADAFAPLEDVRKWRERGDGSVVLADAGGEVLVEMTVSDGGAFESFRPQAPLILLTPLR
jgi:hypothetical protein